MFIPSCTYRIQLNESFSLQHLQAILPYLHRLGVSTLYASPLTTALKGSSHGYDVTNPLALNPDIGTEAQWKQLNQQLRQYGMSWIQDIVPNHMAYDPSNPWIYDVLQRGGDSLYYSWFDHNSDGHLSPALPADGLMAPFLGSPLADCLRRGELTLQFTHLGFVIRYGSMDYPVAIRSYRWILTMADGCPPEWLAPLDSLEAALTADPDAWRAAKDDWLRLMSPDPAFRGFVTARIVFINRRIHLLDSLLQNQPYRLTHHRLAASYINYRRFFTVNSLICLCMEHEAVFNAWHQAIYRWRQEGLIDGLRIDHIDGLALPYQYLQRLRRLFGPDTYIIAEKILSAQEAMPADWPIEGTTGYDFLADAGQLLTDAGGAGQLKDFYRQSIADHLDYEALVFRKKYDFLCQNMGGEWDNLLRLLTSLQLPAMAEQDSLRLKQALGVWMASFPVYRAYPAEDGLSPADIGILTIALDHARRRQPQLQPEFDLLAAIYTTPAGGHPDSQRLHFLRRLAQFTGPLAAKGIEDTTFYVYNPFIGHCEVGDTPAVAGISSGEFHRRMQVRRATQPHSLNATTTHDTKRGEDARIRLHYCTAIPQEWINAVTRWRQLNAPHIAAVNGRPSPSPNDEYLIYQSLLGAWPEDGVLTDTFRQRYAGYLTKALREAKTETNYDDPDEAYEQQCQDFVGAILRPGAPFLPPFQSFAAGVIRHSAVYSLSQLLLKLTAPGIPDVYQGAELWETSLVDPDNRRPVDHSIPAALLDGLQAAEARGAAAAIDYARQHAAAGAEKLLTLYRTLACRNRLPQLFAEGDYIPLTTEGALLAYLRRWGHHQALVAIPLIRRDATPSSPVAITLPPDTPAAFTDVFTGETLRPVDNRLHWPHGLTGWPVVLATA